MYLLFSLLHCAVSHLSQTVHLSLWIATVVCVTDESSPLSGGSLGGGANFCASKHWQSCIAPWWETGPRHLIDRHANVTRWLRTPQARKHKDCRACSLVLDTQKTRLDTQNESLHIKSSSFSSSPQLNNVTRWYLWLISLGHVTEQGTGCHWSRTDSVLPFITQTQDAPSWKEDVLLSTSEGGWCIQSGFGEFLDMGSEGSDTINVEGSGENQGWKHPIKSG